MDVFLSVPETIFRVFIAALLGALIGWEREMKDKPAGLRTHMLVSLGSASFTLIMFELHTSLKGTGSSGDPLRVIQAIVGGIGFLGAGAIIQSRGSVEGITTAAGIWVVGAIGVACGGGNYFIAAITVGLSLIILTALRIVEKQMKKKKS